MPDPITMREIKATREWHHWVEGLEEATSSGLRPIPTLDFAAIVAQALLLRALATEMDITTDELIDQMD